MLIRNKGFSEATGVSKTQGELGLSAVDNAAFCVRGNRRKIRENIISFTLSK
jgi:hypothetical protein